ncbi:MULTISPECIES: type III secretion system inner rod subunit SctI [Yersinia]|uniref:Putative type III secretion apparatus n=1 Tax=Yersinia intermedia TaxID=631 RepID=A0A0H5M1A3_YERIN|nr:MULTISPECIES: type III secretion system inner rod subunit SctI [Yersinia]MCB5307079.1 type III secretion system inner rod subunit SctI [Yersinia massiliensis]CRY56832.1 putative type III secretion apparatus [Yersinia intermedia]
MDTNVIQAASALSTSLLQPTKQQANEQQPAKQLIDPQQVARFEQLMQPTEPAAAIMAPDQMLMAQVQWMHATLAIDVTAKVAGVVGQNINKLVNMQ